MSHSRILLIVNSFCLFVQLAHAQTGTGACCFDNGGCLQNLDMAFCEDVLGGFFAGENTDCDLGACDFGTCCVVGICVPWQTQSNCWSVSGQWTGELSDCVGICNPCTKCDDGDPCTDDSCDPATGCVYVDKECPEGDVCDDGFCHYADSVLDQFVDSTYAISAGFGYENEIAQTFTVGITGMLVQVDVFIERWGASPLSEFFFEIRRTIEGVPADLDPGEIPLASVTVPGASIPTEYGWVSFRIAAPITEGDVLAIVLRTSSGGYSWMGPRGAYPRGAAYFKRPPDFPEWITYDGGGPYDFGFRTYVDGVVADTDGDGIPDVSDVCDNTPIGIPVDTHGRPIGDIDRDCDTDLEDFALLQRSFTSQLEPDP